jgi:hypothetical protein
MPHQKSDIAILPSIRHVKKGIIRYVLKGICVYLINYILVHT